MTPPGPESRQYRLLALLVGAAIVLRLVILASRGDYVAFDEGWYLLLGRSVWSGEGYTLSGLVHVTLSPLFPLVSGLLALAAPNIVWGGRIVAAVAAGLLVLPCWFIFHRLASHRTAVLGCLLVALLPSLAAFAAPYWVGWDLWVGAEPLLHLLLFSGIALLLRARDTHRWYWWALAGVAFGTAYLARSEAILMFGVVGLMAGIEQVLRRDAAGVRRTLVCLLAFLLTAAPYWLYLREHLGRWALTGRAVQLAPAASPARAAPSDLIERMLWGGGEQDYVGVLYGLNDDATALSSSYWGLPAPAQPAPAREAPKPERAEVGGAPADDAEARPIGVEPRQERSSRLWLYVRALGVVMPWYLWPFALFGMIAAGRRRRAELLVALPLVVTSIAIARVVATDPRTQLFIAPLAAFYAACGIMIAGGWLDRRLRSHVRTDFAMIAIAAMACLALLATEARWVVNGITVGSPHHFVGSANRAVGDVLQRIVPRDEPIMSWHPAIALYAERDWRVLPQASFPEVVRYANTIGCEFIVLSRYYPGSDLVDLGEHEHLVVYVPADAPPEAQGWWIEVERGDSTAAVGRLHYTAMNTGPSTSQP